MSKPSIDVTPGRLTLSWRKRSITSPGGGILRFYTGSTVLGSDAAEWRQSGASGWIGRWRDVPASINWAVSEDGEGLVWDVSFNAERPLACERLELVLPLVADYHAWRAEVAGASPEILDPGLFGERYNLDFLDLRASGFFPPAATGARRYHLLTASPRPALHAGSLSPKRPLIRIEALSDVNLSAISTSPEDGGARELCLIAWPGRDMRREMPPGTQRIRARIVLGKPPLGWIEDVVREHLDAVGAVTGKVLQGPLEAQISPTNRCNQRCVPCWCHASFRRELSGYADWASRQMDIRFFGKLVDEIALSGTPVVSLIGQGDPLCHKDILDMVRMVKNRGMRCRLNTNGLLLNHALNSALVETGLDRLHVSLWAARPETYARLHPGGCGSELERIEAALAHLTKIRERARPPHPHLELFHALCKENIGEIDDLIEQAERVGADSIYIRPMCVIRGRTEHLLPSRSELDKLRDRLAEARARLEASSRLRINFSEYLEQVSSSGAPEGRYRGHRLDKPCYLGWGYVVIQTEGAMSPCCLGGPMAGPMTAPHEFLPLWMSGAFQEFRIKCLDMKSNAEYFLKRFPCSTECCMDAVNDVVEKKVAVISSLSREFPSFRRTVKRAAREAEKRLFRLLRHRKKIGRLSPKIGRARPSGAEAAPAHPPCDNP